MSDKTLFKCIINTGDDATGVHEETTGTEELIEAKYKKLWPDVYFEEQADGRILVFRSKSEADDEENAVGTVERVS